jgi:cellulose synthase/poly-beta-1,6-N-acetylglucosamine synthase-like glycosyltransferase
VEIISVERRQLSNDSKETLLILILNTLIVFTLIYMIIVLIIWLGTCRPQHGRMSASYRVSVVIAARNEENSIGDLLEDLCHQTWPEDSFQVIVANDNSSDSTQLIVDQFVAEHPNFHQIVIRDHPPHFSPKKYALEKAIEQSEGEIILATDADCRVGSRWIETIVSYFTPQVGFVIGFSQFGRKHKSYSLVEGFQAIDFLSMMGVALGSTNLGAPWAASGQNLAFRRDAFETIGGYQSIAHRISGDDVLLMQLIRRHTLYKIIFASHPAAFVTSRPQSTVGEFIDQRKRWASNGSYQLKLDKLFFGFLSFVWLYNTAMLLGLFLVLPLFPVAYLGCVAGKLIAELLISAQSARIFKRLDLLVYFPVWFLIQSPYISIVGFLGCIGQFRWKNRKHSATIRDHSRNRSRL